MYGIHTSSFNALDYPDGAVISLPRFSFSTVANRDRSTTMSRKELYVVVVSHSSYSTSREYSSDQLIAHSLHGSGVDCTR